MRKNVINKKRQKLRNNEEIRLIHKNDKKQQKSTLRTT